MKKKAKKKLALSKETLRDPLRHVVAGYYNTFTCTACGCATNGDRCIF